VVAGRWQRFAVLRLDNIIMAPSSEQVNTFDEQAARVAEWAALLIEPGQVVELRALMVQRRSERPHTEAGFFDSDHLREMAATALQLTKYAKGVYFTLNPVNPDLLARRAYRTNYAHEGELTSDKDVILRRWLLVDADPVRDTLISATDEEKAQASATVQRVRDHLRSRSWPDPIFSDSGNGYHLLYRIDLPAADNGLVERLLQALAAQFSDARVNIDTTVFNPSRICKLPGTLARKGDNIPTRPHRRARLLEVPGQLAFVPEELLQALAAEAPEPAAPHSPQPSTNGSSSGNCEFKSRLLVDKWLSARGVAFRLKSEPDSKGRTVYVLKECPFDHSHGDPDSCIMQAQNGGLSARCFHNSCSGRGWQEFKKAIGAPDPDHWDPPLKRGPKIKGSSKGNTSGTGEKREAHAIILQYFQERYKPVFRRGDQVYSEALRRDIRRTEACATPDIQIITRLVSADNVPVDKEGVVKYNALPAFYAQWSKVAWGSLIAGLPDEETAEEVAESAEAEFLTEVSTGLLQFVTIGLTQYVQGEEVTRTERRPILHFAVRFAKGDRWQSVRGFSIWSRVVNSPAGIPQFEVAIRSELFSQIHFRPLEGMGRTKFSRLCEHYGVGRADKATGKRAVILEQDFLQQALPDLNRVVNDSEQV
jgi:hypothetical protein